jgi:hypothetical protein
MALDQVASEIARDEKDRQAMTLPNRAAVSTVITSTEQLQIESLNNVGVQRTVVRHPYMGINSWMRVMPEAGTPLMTQQRGDRAQLEVWGYIQNTLPNRLLRNKAVGATGVKPYLFRELYEGELEFMSKGRSYMHLSEGGDIDLRGGTIHTEMLQTDLRHRTQAPTHNRTLHLYDHTTLAHEEAFGVVRRPDQQNPDIVSTFIRRSDQSFAVEHSRWINKKDGKPLVEKQEGNVYGPDGTEVKQGSTNKPLRSYKRWYDDNNLALSVEIDEQLNVLVTSTNTAKETILKLGSQNVLDITAKQLKMNFLTTGLLAFTNSVEVRSPKTNVVGTTINLGSSAAVSPVMLGDRFNSSMMTPLIAVLAATFQALSASSAFTSEPPVKAALSGASTTLSSLTSTFPTYLSQIVKVLS